MYVSSTVVFFCRIKHFPTPVAAFVSRSCAVRIISIKFSRKTTNFQVSYGCLRTLSHWINIDMKDYSESLLKRSEILQVIEVIGIVHVS